MNLLSGVYTRTEKYESDFYMRIDLLNEPEKYYTYICHINLKIINT